MIVPESFVIDEDIADLAVGKRRPVYGLIVSTMFPAPEELRVSWSCIF